MIKRFLRVGGVIYGLALVAMLGTGCGKVSPSPLAPFINPPIYDGFDQGLGGWGWRAQKYLGQSLSSIPVGTTVASATDRTFGGSLGSIKLGVNLGAVGDSLDTGYAYSSTTDVGFNGKTLSMWAFWDSGLTNSTGKVIAKFYVKATNSFTYTSGPDCTLVQGRWVQVIWSLPQDPTLTQVREWGIEVYGATGPFSPGVVYLDQLAF